MKRCGMAMLTWILLEPILGAAPLPKSLPSPAPEAGDPLAWAFHRVAQQVGPTIVAIQTEVQEREEDESGKIRALWSLFDLLRQGYASPLTFPEPERERLRKELERQLKESAGHRTGVGQGAGSGVIIAPEGLIITNDHVVKGAREITVLLPDLQKHKAILLGSDLRGDLALLRISPRKALVAAPLGDSDELRVGSWAVALGNSFDLSRRDGEPTMTVGIISALHRVAALDGGRRLYADAIQTDAAINPGNSGGGLFNLQGELVGINSAITSNTGNNAGVGFAIPINQVKAALPSLAQGRQITHGFWGVHLKSASGGQPGVIVTGVSPGSPAEKSGLRKGDIVVSVDRKPMTGYTDLVNYLSPWPVGVDFSLVCYRNGQPVILTSRLELRTEKHEENEKGE